GLSRSLRRAGPCVDCTVGSRGSEEILRDAIHRRSEVGIVGTTLNDRMFFDEGLVLPVQKKPGLDRDWSVFAEDPFGHMRAYEVAHFPSRIRVQFEPPL